MKTTDDSLAQLFRKLPAEELPEALKAGIMERAVAETGRRRLYSYAKGIMIAAFVSLVVIAGVIFLFGYIEQPSWLAEIFDGRYNVVFIVALLALGMLITETIISQRMIEKSLKNI